MSCDTVLASLCAQDIAQMAMERRADCPGRLWNSGIIRPNGVLSTLANGGTWSTNYHFWSFLQNLADNTGFPGTDATCPPCETVGKKNQTARKLFRTKCWEKSDLNEQCNINDASAEDVIEGLLGDWALDIAERDVYSILRGLYLNNVADDASDLVYLASDASTNSLPNYLTKDAMLEALARFGCKRSDFGGLLVHEDVFLSLEKRDLIMDVEVNCDDGACVSRKYFMNKEIIEVADDRLTVDGSGGGGYISIPFREGAIGFGVGEPEGGNFESDRDPSADCGAGSSSYHQREQYSIHPVGWSNRFDEAAAGHENMTFDDLAAPASWCRTHDPKNVGLAFIVSTEA